MRRDEIEPDERFGLIPIGWIFKWLYRVIRRRI